MSGSRHIKTHLKVMMIAAAFIIPMAGKAHAYSGEGLAKNAKITMSEARSIAVKAHPGTITDEELEKEGGGSGLRYSFDVKNGAKTYEVGVDAITGKVLENSVEGKNPD